VAALRREGWEAPRPAAVQPAEGMAAQDHDDPTAPLQVVENW
jgi:hypothetical protein